MRRGISVRRFGPKQSPVRSLNWLMRFPNQDTNRRYRRRSNGRCALHCIRANGRQTNKVSTRAIQRRGGLHHDRDRNTRYRNRKQLVCFVSNLSFGSKAKEEIRALSLVMAPETDQASPPSTNVWATLLTERPPTRKFQPRGGEVGGSHPRPYRGAGTGTG